VPFSHELLGHSLVRTALALIQKDRPWLMNAVNLLLSAAIAIL